jgi:hypothetical protein
MRLMPAEMRFFRTEGKTKMERIRIKKLERI